MKLSGTGRVRFFVVASSLLGVFLLVGCGSSSSSTPGGIGGKMESRVKKLQEAKTKVATGKK